MLGFSVTGLPVRHTCNRNMPRSSRRQICVNGMRAVGAEPSDAFLREPTTVTSRPCPIAADGSIQLHVSAKLRQHATSSLADFGLSPTSSILASGASKAAIWSVVDCVVSSRLLMGRELGANRIDGFRHCQHQFDERMVFGAAKRKPCTGDFAIKHSFDDAAGSIQANGFWLTGLRDVSIWEITPWLRAM